MKNINKSNESGRSMVEMLGVLAIIGVLSIGGIAGYTTAIRSHRANEIVNAISMLYVSGKSLNEGSGTGTMTYEALGSWPEGSSNISYTDGIITATISEQDICKQVLGKLGSLVTAGDCSAANGPYALTATLGDAPAGNCWTTNPPSCREEDLLDTEYEAWCDDSLHSKSYCNGAPDSFEEKYINCRIEGKSAYYCDCVNTGNSPAKCETIDSCRASGESTPCCNCRANAPDISYCTGVCSSN